MSLLSSTYRIFFAAAAVVCIFLFPDFSSAADPSESNKLPALLLSGTLDDTPQTVTPCEPLNIQYSIKNTGTIPVSRGQLTIEIRSVVTGQSVFVRQFPFTTLEPDSFMIEHVDFPQGAYTITMRASAMNVEHQIARDYTLAKQALTVSAPMSSSM